MSDVSSPEEDYRLMILIVVASFIILSLILIIGITSCLLICFEDTDQLHLTGDGQKVGEVFFCRVRFGLKVSWKK